MRFTVNTPLLCSLIDHLCIYISLWFVQVLWFEPSLKSLHEHNWYGNVSFVISMDTLISRFGPNFYYFDKEEFETHTTSKIILSNRSLTLAKVDLEMNERRTGAALLLHRTDWGYGGNSWLQVIRCRSNHYGTMVIHNLEIGIDVTYDDCFWIYEASSIDANNHEFANTGIGPSTFTCHRYSKLNNQCPYACDKEMAFNKLKLDYPNLPL